MKLITETIEHEVHNVIVEQRGGEKTYYIEGPFIHSEVKNKNNRVYPRGMMEQVVEKYRNEMINTKRAIGELNHPTTPQLNYERASHLIESLIQEGNTWIGKARILKSLPMGRIVQGLIDEGLEPGVSMRGIGGLKTTPKGVVVENYKMATAADVVTEPSQETHARGVILHGVMENIDWIYDPITENYEAHEITETIKKEMHKGGMTEGRKLQLIESFLKSL